MTETVNAIEAAISAHWGERCPEFYEGCPCCGAWADYDALTCSDPAVRDRVTDEMVEAAYSHLASWGNREIEWGDHLDDLRAAFTAALRMSPPEPASGLPELIVDKLFDDLRDRRFLKWLFSEHPTLIGTFEHDGSELRSLDADVQEEIRADWAEIIARSLSTPPAKEPQ